MRSAVVAVALLLLVGACTPSWGYGYFNWYGGYGAATATGYNGWNYNSSSSSWSWGGPASLSVYASTYPPTDSKWAWGWNTSLSASASNGGRSAWANASTWNAGWSWWGVGGYLSASAGTSGWPSYASATARSTSYWSYNYWVPRSWWNTWSGRYGWYVPYYYNWYYWGWIDDQMGIAADQWVVDNVDGGKTTSVVKDGFFDNGGGTYDHWGTSWAGSDLQWSADVDGLGHAGWNIIGHDGSSNENPYQYVFYAKAKEVGGDADNIEIQNDFVIDGRITSTPEPPYGLLLLLSVFCVSWVLRRRYALQ